MHRQRAAVALLLLGLALASPGLAGTAADPELTDPTGDQAVVRPTSGVPGLPTLPVLDDDTFADVDIASAWFQEPDGCPGTPSSPCPELVLVVATSGGWGGGTLTATFLTRKGPTSYAAGNASGQEVTVTVAGTAVAGVANASAEAGTEGLRIRMPTASLGLVGGDEVANLTLATQRTDPGPVTDPQVTQDDTSATDEAGPGRTYTMRRPAPVSDLAITVLALDDQSGATLRLDDPRTVQARLRVSNLGTDDDAFSLAVTSDPPLRDPPVFAAVLTAIPAGEDVEVTVPIALDGMPRGRIEVTFTVTSGRGAQDDAVATFLLAQLPAGPRGVVPEGLDFLTPAAEGLGLDKAFGRYAELTLLALLVLVAILTVFLLVALAPSRLGGAAAPEAPALAKAPEQAPAAVAAAVGTRSGAVPAPAGEPEAAVPAEAPASPAAATKGGALAIESVTHDPAEPEEGEEVTTEAVLRNPGPTRQVRVVLSLDGADVDEKPVTLPARATKTVRLAWTAGEGDNHVKVRVLPA